MHDSRRSFRYVVLVPLAILALACAAASALGALRVGTSGWEWSNPSPQGADLIDIAVIDAKHGYAVVQSSSGKTLLATGDAGETWASLTGVVGNDVQRIIPVSASTVIALGHCGARRSDDGGAAFTPLTFPADGSPCANGGIRAASFATPTIGMVLMFNGAVLATNDGGITFTRRTNLPPAQTAIDLVMTSHAVAFASTSAGVVQTTDGGTSWTTRLVGPPIWSITFPDETTGYAVGPTAVHKSTDGGSTWGVLPNGTPAVGASRVSCATPDVCLFATSTLIPSSSTTGSLARTADGGATFSSIGPTPGTRAAAFFSPTRAVAVGDLGRIAVSDDGGATWRAIDRRLARRMTALRANPDGLAFTWGPEGALALTSNRGVTWREFTLPTSNKTREVSFASKDVGFAVDSAGAVFRTTTGGVTWARLNTAKGFTPIAVHALTEKRVLLLGAGGALRRSDDGGRTFVATGTATGRVLAQRIQRAGSAVAVHGSRGIAISTNGRNWRVIGPLIVGGRVRSLRLSQCTSTVVCWAATSDRRLFRTVNAGRTWTERSAGVGFPGYDYTHLAFENRVRGYVVKKDFDVLRTIDAGMTWTPVTLPTLRTTIQTSSGIDYAIGTTHAHGKALSNLFTTTTGGLRGTPSVLTLTPSVHTIAARTQMSVTGRLTPAVGGERVLVSRVDPEHRNYQTRTATAKPDGRFSAKFTISRTTTFVAQWVGDGLRAGDGSPAITVRRR